MKSLKRTLSLVLALVMVLGLFGGLTMTASASDFTDDEKIQYKEAVDVMTGIGAIDGYKENGEFVFKPTENITRAEAAKLVTYTVLGESAAKRLTGVTTKFSDVPADKYKWAIPSIAYLTQAGIINGMGDGTFKPEDPVTGYEIGKMLLCALGYGKKGEYTGSQWQFQVALDGIKSKDDAITGGKIAVFDGRAEDSDPLSEAATREEVALYCFNTIQLPQVEYVSALDIYVDKNNGALSNQIGCIGEEVYGYDSGNDETNSAKLGRKASGITDSFGRPAYKWTYNKSIINLSVEKPILTFTKGITVKALDLAISNAKCKHGATQDDITVNKLTKTNNITWANLTDPVGDSGNGVVTEVFASAGTVTKIIQIRNYPATVTAVTPDKAETTNVDERTITLDTIEGTPVTGITIDSTVPGFDKVYSVVAPLFEAGQVPVVSLVTNDSNTNHAGANATTVKSLSVRIPETVRVEVSSIKNDTATGALVSFVSDGKTYEVIEGYTVADNGAVSVGSTYDVLLDEYGYVMKATPYSETANIGVVVDVDTSKEVFEQDEFMAKVVTLEGGEPIVMPIVNTSSWADGDAADGDLKNLIVTYTPATGVNEGKFTLTAVGTKTEQKLTVTTGKVEMTDDNAGSVKANDNTVFIIETISQGKSTYTAYKGINNVPSLVGGNAGDQGWYVSYDKPTIDQYADVVYVRDATIREAVAKTAFLLADTSKVITTKTAKVYAATLIADGASQGVYVVADMYDQLSSDHPILASYTIKDGVITSATPFTANDTTEAGYGIGLKRVNANVVSLGEKKLAYVGADTSPTDAKGHTFTDDCAVWEIDGATVTQKNVNQIQDSNTDLAYWVEATTNNRVSSIYIVKNTLKMNTLVIVDDSAGSDPKHELTSDGKDWTGSKNTQFTATATPAVSGDAATGSISYKWEFKMAGAAEWNTASATNNTFTLAKADIATASIAKGTLLVRCTVTDTGFAPVSVTIPVTITQAS